MKYALVVALAGSALAAGSAFAAFTGNLGVIQVGDGAAPLGSSAAITTLRAYNASLTGALHLQSWTFNHTGPSRRLTNSGSAGSEGYLTISTDGRYLTNAGYDAAPGTLSVATTSTGGASPVYRTIARFDLASEAVEYTATTGFTSGNIRSAITQDGSSYWATGNASSASSAGVRYLLHDTESVTPGTQLSSSPTNTRVVNIFNGQLFVSTMSGMFRGVNTVGDGLPTTAGQTTTLLPGFNPASGSVQSVYDFFFASSTVLYVADDASPANGGGLQKWIFNPSADIWERRWVINALDHDANPGTANIAPGLRGLAGEVDALGNVLLFATTANTGSNYLVALADTVAGITAPAAEFNLLDTSDPNTAFRGVELVPSPAAPAVLGLGALLAARRRRP